jgi:hypothetical protein
MWFSCLGFQDFMRWCFTLDSDRGPCWRLLQESVVIKLTLLRCWTEIDSNISNTRACATVKYLTVLYQRQRQTSFQGVIYRNHSVVMRFSDWLQRFCWLNWGLASWLYLHWRFFYRWFLDWWFVLWNQFVFLNTRNRVVGLPRAFL